MFCGDCGSNWVGVSSRKNELSYNWYRCKEYLNHQKCKVPGIKSTLLEEIIIEATCNFLKSKMSMDMMAKSIYEEQGKKSPLLQSMENDYKDTSEKMKNILSAIEKGADFSMLQERYKALEVTKKTLETNIALENSKNIKYSFEEIANGLASISASDFQSEKDKRDLIDTFINSVFVYPDGKVTLLFSNNPHLAPVKKDEMEKMDVEKAKSADYLEYVKGTGIFGISFKPKSLRFATQAKSKKRSIYMNSTERYNTDLQRILQMLNGIQPYDKDIDLKKRGKRLVGKECHPIRKS